MEQMPAAWERSLYFLSYAVVASFATVVMAIAFYARHKREGTPINYTVLSMTGMSALAMWIGVGLTEWIYVPRTFAAGLTAFFIGVTIAIFMTWQLMRLARRIESDRRTIQELATTDALTGLLNLRMFHQRLEEEVSRAMRFEHPLSLMVADIVDLGEINDKYGYTSGDLVLQEIGRRLADTARSFDLVFRLGGDTIAIILLQTDGPATEAFAKRLVQLMTDPPFELGGWARHAPIVSVGIASVGGVITDDRLMIKGAKKASATASAEGDNIIARQLPDGAMSVITPDAAPPTASAD